MPNNNKNAKYAKNARNAENAKNGGICIANKGLEQMHSLEQTFLWAIALQAYLYINIYGNLFIGLFITGDPADC